MARIIGQGDADGLRKVEKDVLIMKKVKKRSFEICGNEVKGTSTCIFLLVLICKVIHMSLA